jgi:hypothetical protein
MSDVTSRIDDLVAQVTAANWKARDALKVELTSVIRSAENQAAAREHLEGKLREIHDLEVRWELQAVLEETAPPPPPPPAAPPAPPPEEAGPKKLNPSDLVLVYDDPRGLLLHRTKTGDRWFATQADPRTQQPQTFELRAQEISQLKVQLAGSPYWVLGASPA